MGGRGGGVRACVRACIVVVVGGGGGGSGGAAAAASTVERRDVFVISFYLFVRCAMGVHFLGKQKH